MVFNREYACVYDYLYQDKDYEKECNFLEAIFDKYNLKPKTILDLGCGTGGHAIILAERGYNVTGVDRSPSMLEIAKRKAEKAGLDIVLVNDDITKYSPDGRYDVVIAMFAAMSYQTTNNAIARVCRMAKESLVPGGLFTFDCWNGLAVLNEKPVLRIKDINLSDGTKLVRLATPEIDLVNHIVKVNYRLWRYSPTSHHNSGQCNAELGSASYSAQLLTSGYILEESFETHTMRFIFPQEIRYFLEVAGFGQVDFFPFLELDKQLTEKDWNMTVVGR